MSKSEAGTFYLQLLASDLRHPTSAILSSNLHNASRQDAMTPRLFLLIIQIPKDSSIPVRGNSSTDPSPFPIIHSGNNFTTHPLIQFPR
jgi:hypothetical protein